MYKLVVSDMDGTLLNSNNQVSEKNKEAFKALLKNDVHVAIATGRIYTSARVYANHLDMVTPIIACNGAVIRNLEDDHILYESHIQKEDCLKVIEVLRKHHTYFHYYSLDTFYTEKLAHSSLKYSEWNKTLKEEERIQINVIKDSYEQIKNSDENIYKFNVINDDYEALDCIKEELKEIETIEVSKSWHNNLEIMNKGVSKGKAIDQLASILGVEQEEVMTFGDNENDISMLTYAGMGVAMGNAEEIVKKQADYVTATNDEDGVAKALEKFIL
ncbi:MAG: Cof-type HAD-IIB family hydrolase [Marinisporobacter sp.]|jgi:Cof subfamily protein (haloacid dehalogenase superfamily)|nr:Cof-type HAD-IIB family hydrolase [Marinisporobacter sp.]